MYLSRPPGPFPLSSGFGEHVTRRWLACAASSCEGTNPPNKVVARRRVPGSCIREKKKEENVSMAVSSASAALSKFKLASEKQDSRDVKIKTRTQLKILGRWLGLVTLGRNRPLLTSTIDLKSLLYCGFTEQNSKNSSSKYFLPAVPFVSKVITSAAADSIVFRIPNPWTVAILRVLQKIYQR